MFISELEGQKRRIGRERFRFERRCVTVFARDDDYDILIIFFEPWFERSLFEWPASSSPSGSEENSDNLGFFLLQDIIQGDRRSLSVDKGRSNFFREKSSVHDGRMKYRMYVRNRLTKQAYVMRKNIKQQKDTKEFFTVFPLVGVRVVVGFHLQYSIL